MKEGFTLVVPSDFLKHLPSGRMEVPKYVPKEQKPYLPDVMDFAVATYGRLKRTEKKVDFILRVTEEKIQILLLWGQHSQRSERFAECGIEVFSFEQPGFPEFLKLLSDEKVCIRFDRETHSAHLKKYKPEAKHPA